MISYIDEELKATHSEALEKKLLETASDMVYNTGEIDELEDDEIEDFNEEYLKYNQEKVKNHFIRSCQPGTYNCHEALDNTSDLMNSVARLMEKDSIVANLEWFTLAHKAHTLLFNLYQEIGAVHLDAIPENILDLIEAKKK